MSGNAKYITVLIAFIGSAMGYVYVGSEVRTVYITGKHIEDGRGRRGQATKRFVIETDKGSMPILKFPIIRCG